jgi:cytochrome bd ubiquinol oxidase subunit II
MHLYLIPMVFILIGLVMYTVLAGADFGAGMWELTAGRGPKAAKIRDHAHRAIGPVWEANHVWLIFVVTVAWTSYPLAFGSIASTLCVPLFIAAVGIILRGASYAFRSGARSPHELRPIDTAFACSSILTPFALGTVVGAIASGRVPVGNAAGDLITSWLNPTSIMIGALAVATGGYLAAAYLAADAVRIGDAGLAQAFRARALVAGVIAGGLAMGGLVVLNSDAHHLYQQLLSGRALPALIVSIAAGVTAVGLVWARRYEPARYTAAVAAAAIVAGWALAQAPTILPGLTVADAAAPHDTLVLIIVAVLAGGAVLFPALALLFGLVLHGTFDPAATPATADVRPATAAVAAVRPGLAARAAVACLVAGLGLLNIADARWAHAVGVGSLFAFVGFGFAAFRPAELAGGPSD